MASDDGGPLSLAGSNNNNNNNSENNNNNISSGSSSYSFNEAKSFVPLPTEPWPAPGIADDADMKRPLAAWCRACGSQISERFFLQVGDWQFHAVCLRCGECGCALDGAATCFCRDGAVFCRDDYYRLFSTQQSCCSRCGLLLSPSDLVMRARSLLFHLSCFTCQRDDCRRCLSPGDEFGISASGGVLCKLHFLRCTATARQRPPKGRPRKRRVDAAAAAGATAEAAAAAAAAAALPPHATDAAAATEAATAVAEVAASVKEEPASMEAAVSPMLGQQPDLHEVSVQQCASDSCAAASPNSIASHATQRQKRVRTSFKHHQLRTMKSYFIINHNPDSKDLKQLAQKTGLSKRVLQVWFQNARAKYRRSLLKQQGPQAEGEVAARPEQLANQSAAQRSRSATSPDLSDLSSTGSAPEFSQSALSEPLIGCELSFAGGQAAAAEVYFSVHDVNCLA